MVVRRLAPDWGQRMSFYRFLRNRRVTVDGLLDAQGQTCGLDRAAGHVLVLTDTTTVDLTAHRGRLDPTTVGPVGDGRGLGLLAHVALCLAADVVPEAAVLGIGSLRCWARPATGTRFTRHYKQQPVAAKESHKWVRAAQDSRRRLPAASRLTLVGDREADNYATLAQWQALGVDFLVRCRQDRRVQPAGTLFARLAATPVQARLRRPVAATRPTAGAPTRQATLQVRYAPYTVRRPVTAPGQPAQLACWAVYVGEDDPPPGETPVCWRLLTSHPVQDAAQAQQVAGWYAQRWWVEQLFRVLKQQGLGLEDTQLTDGRAVARLLALALPAAVQVLQLARARHNLAPAPASVLPPAARPLAHRWVAQLQARAAQQSNGYPPDSLAWVAWLFARLGGWAGLPSERPPGVITLLRGAMRFQQFFEDSAVLDTLVYTP